MEENPIAQNIQKIREDIKACALQHHRDPGLITLIGVSKYFPAQAAEDAVKAGLADLGENRVMELLEKRDLLSAHGLHPDWHLIGTLQRKKVKLIVGKTRLIHSVDSVELLAEISKCSLNIGIKSPILLQSNISHEETKHGFDPSEIHGILDRISDYPGIDLQGLMTMAPLTQDETVLAGVFSSAQELFNEIRKTAGPSFRILSMGMSNDYPVAIKYGATHLRIGTAIFGTRTLHP